MLFSFGQHNSDDGAVKGFLKKRENLGKFTFAKVRHEEWGVFMFMKLLCCHGSDVRCGVLKIDASSFIVG